MATPASPPPNRNDPALDQEIELYGPDNGGWYTTRVHDWIGLCDELRDPDVRGYLILRSLVIEKWKNPVRKMTMRILCQLIPSGKKGEPSSHSRVRVMLKSLGAAGLVVNPDTGEAIKTSSRDSSLDKPLRLRINDMPKPGYKGWRNAEAKLAFITGQAPVDHPGQEASGAGSNSNPGTSQGTPEAGPSSAPGTGAGSNSDPSGLNSDPLGSDSNPETGSDLRKRDLPLVPSLGTSLSGAAGEHQQQESRGSVAREREAAEPKNNNPADSPAGIGESGDVDKVVDAYIAAYMTAVNLPPQPDAIKSVRAAAAALLSAGRSVGNLCDLAAELPGKGWTDLVRHALHNPEAAARPAVHSKPWCGECNYGQEPTFAAGRMREGTTGRMEKCHCHPGYVPPQPSHA